VNEAWELKGVWVATIGFSAGALFMMLIDFYIPHMRFGEPEIRQINLPEQASAGEAGHPGRRHRGMLQRTGDTLDQKLYQSGLLIAIGITIHNIPEGIAVGASYLYMPEFGVFISLGILLHNIPEGIATALPLCKSGICRWDSFRAALYSGLAEPIGALLAAVFLTSFQSLIPASLAFAGGVMVFITLDELVPLARQYGHQHFTALGIISGTIAIFILSGLFDI
jgi:ZIP family zinc transporter